MTLTQAFTPTERTNGQVFQQPLKPNSIPNVTQNATLWPSPLPLQATGGLLNGFPPGVLSQGVLPLPTLSHSSMAATSEAASPTRATSGQLLGQLHAVVGRWEPQKRREALQWAKQAAFQEDCRGGGCGNVNGKGCSSRGRVTEDQVLHRGHPSQRWGEGGAGEKESQKVRLLRQQKEKWSVQNLKRYVPFLGLIFACIRGNQKVTIGS